MKKVLSIVLSVVMIFSMTTVAVAKEATDENVSDVSIKEEIIRNYNDKLVELKFQSIETTTLASRTSDLQNAKLELQKETVDELHEAGYEAYDVNPQTFKEIEATLNTDLSSAGLSENGSYIILIEGENENIGISSRAHEASPFEYTYNGNTYTLRYMTMYVTDDPNFEKYSQVNLLESKSRNVIEHFLDATISIVVGEICKELGIVKTILGIDISDFLESYDAYWDYNASTTWTRTYTQVWDTYYQTWMNGSCVEVAEMASYLNGWYYDVTMNTKNSLVTDCEKKQVRSEQYYDLTWRKENAVIGYLNYAIQWDVTDSVKYRHGDKVIITHYNNF